MGFVPMNHAAQLPYRVRALHQGTRTVLLLHNSIVPHLARSISGQRQSLYASGLGITIIFPAMTLRTSG